MVTFRMILLTSVLSAWAWLSCGTAVAGEGDAADVQRWNAYRDGQAKDSATVRFYAFDKVGDEIPNLAGNGAGTLLLSACEPYYIKELYSGWKTEFPRWTEGRVKGKPALCFRSAVNSVTCSQFYRTSTGVMTVEAWVRTHLNKGVKGGAFLFSVGSGFNDGWLLGTTFYNTGLRIGRPKEQGGDVALDVPVPLTGHVWHHVVAVIDTNALRLYIDGALAGEKQFEGAYVQPEIPGGSFAQFPEEARGGLKIGSVREPLNSVWFDCDELTIHEKALSTEKIASRYASGRPSQSPEEQEKAHLALTAAQARADMIVLDLPHERLGYLPSGAPVALSISIPEAARQGTTAALTAAITDIDRKVVFSGERKVAMAEKGDTADTWEIQPPERCGLYWLEVVMKDQGGTVIKEKTLPFAITVPVPPMSERPASSPLGAHGGRQMWNEVTVLGARCERDISPWRPKLPDGGYDWKHPDFYVDEILKLGMDMLFCEGPHSYDQAELEKVAQGDSSQWEAYLRPYVERYKGRVKYWEICNEPNARGCKPAQYAALLKTAHRVIREVDPQAKIVGLCGVTTYPEWTEEVLAAGGGEFFDILSFHNYIGSSPISEWRRLRKIERTKASLEKHLGKLPPIWNSESGIHQPLRMDGRPLNEAQLLAKYPRGKQENGITLVPADAVAMATEHTGACWQTQSVLLDCALGVEKYFILMGASRFYPAYGSVSGASGWPSEKGVAYAAMASFMTHMKSARLIPIASSTAAGTLVTTTDGRRVAALFADVPTTRAFLVGENQECKGMDYLGNPLSWKAKGKVLTVSFGMEPVYLFDVPEDFRDAPILVIKQFPPMVSPGAKVEGVLAVTNLFPDQLEGKLEITSKDSTVIMNSELKVAPGESREVPFQLAAGALNRGSHAIIAKLVQQDKEIATCESAFESEGVAHGVPKMTAEIKLDAEPAEWEGIPAETSDKASNVVIGKPPVGYYEPTAWQGPKDLAFTVKTAWRPDDGIYFLVDVIDENIKTVSPDKTNLGFLQDGLEFFFDGRPLKEQVATYSFGAEQIIVVPAVRETVQPCANLNFARKGPSVDVEFVGRRTAAGYLIEGRLRPKEASPFKLVPGARFGMDFAIDDAGEAEMTRKTQMALHGTASNSTDTSVFGRYQLLDSGVSESKNILANGDIGKGEGPSVPSWKFAADKLDKMPAAEAAKIKWGAGEVDGRRALWISTGTNAPAHVWWTQAAPAAEGTAYMVSFKAKAVMKGKAAYCYCNGVVYFLGDEGKWLGHQVIGGQGATANGEWGTFTGQFFTPSGTKSIGFRFDAVSNQMEGSADFWCADVVVRAQ